MKASLPAVTSLPDKGPPQKPFVGKVFYLDITSKLAVEKLEKDIKELGGTVEGFLSKEISYLITNKKEAKCAKSLKYMCSTPSPEPAQSISARPNSHKGERQEEGSNKKPEKGDVSRGKSLLKKVMKETKILPKNSILANACNWGVRILHVEEAKMYIEQKKRSLQPVKQADSAAKPVVKRPARRRVKAQKLLSPFIKVEDSSCHYRPLYLVLPFFRSFQPPVSKPGHSVDKKPVAAHKAPEAKHSLNKTWHGQEGVNNSHVKPREEKKQGYCECCLQKYDDLDAHLLSQQHKNYAQGPHYQDVDNLVSLFDFDFVDWSQFKQGAKGSDLLVFSGTQDEKTPLINDQIHQKLPLTNMFESTVVKKTPWDVPHDATPAIVNNTICCKQLSPGLGPAQPVCLSTCVTDSSYKQPVLQIIEPNNETYVSPPFTETGTLLTLYNKDSSQKNMDTQDQNTQGLTEGNPSMSAKHIKNLFTDPGNGLPLKKIKLDDSLCVPPLCPTSQDIDHGAEQPPCGYALCNKTCPLKISEPVPNPSPSSENSKPLRKVKNAERRPRNEAETPPKPKSKISFPLEQLEWSSPTETLRPLFDSSDKQSEFYGFSHYSLDIRDSTEGPEEQLSNHGESIFPDTSSSASTFNGF